MKKFQIATLLAAAFITVAVLCSCVSDQTRTTAWIKDNHKVGTIVTRKQPWGTDSVYKDLSGRICRIEKRNFDGRLVAGICTVQYSYDIQGNLSAEQNFNSDGRLILNHEGYAASAFTYSSDPDGDRIVEEHFLDENNHLVCTKSGFAILRRTEGQTDQIKRIQFFNQADAPSPSVWLGVSGVVDVQYAYLQGVTPILCVAFLDASGNVIERKQLSGQTTAYWSSSTTYYNYYQPHVHDDYYNAGQRH